MPRKAMRDVVVCIPGITGSVLRKDGRDVWNISGGALLSALTTLGREHQRPEARGRPAGRGRPRRRDHRAGGDPRRPPDPGLLEDRRLHEDAPLHRGDVRRHARTNLFEFPYDWRRDNRVAARRLQRQGREWLDAWRASSGASDAKLVLVGHSMGGLISRYFLECLDGWRDTRTLVTFGTPYRGSLNALDTLVNGKKIKFFDLTELARSFTAIHQLLPTYPCYDDGGGRARVRRRGGHPAARPGEGEGGARLPPRDRRRGRRAPRGPAYDDGALRPGAASSGSSSRRSSRPYATATGSSSYRRSSGQDPGRRRDRAPAVGDPARVRGRSGRDVLGRAACLAAERRPPPAPAHGRPHREHDRLGAFRGAVPMIDLSLDVDDLYSTADPVLVRAQPERDQPNAAGGGRRRRDRRGARPADAGAPRRGLARGRARAAARGRLPRDRARRRARSSP